MERNAKNLKEQAYNFLPYLKDSYLEHLVESSRNGPIRLKALLDNLKNHTFGLRQSILQSLLQGKVDKSCISFLTELLEGS